MIGRRNSMCDLLFSSASDDGEPGERGYLIRPPSRFSTPQITTPCMHMPYKTLQDPQN